MPNATVASTDLEAVTAPDYVRWRTILPQAAGVSWGYAALASERLGVGEKCVLTAIK